MSSAEPATEDAGRKKRTKKPPLWHRIIYDDAMVALVRLLGHSGIPRRVLPEKAKPLLEKFGRERLQAVADEIVETIGDGDDEIARLTEQARKLAIQLIGRPKTMDAIESSGNGPVASPSLHAKTIPPTSAIPSEIEPNVPTPSEALTTAFEHSRNPAEGIVEDSATFDRKQEEESSQDWTNYETSCVAAFLHQDRDFKVECRHLATLCCERVARCEAVMTGVQTESQAQVLLLAEKLQCLVCEQNPLAEDDVAPFSELLAAALIQVDWQQLADSFLRRSVGRRGDD